MVLILKAAITVHNMIVEMRRDENIIELHERASAAVENGQIIGENLHDQGFLWNN